MFPFDDVIMYNLIVSTREADASIPVTKHKYYDQGNLKPN